MGWVLFFIPPTIISLIYSGQHLYNIVRPQLGTTGINGSTHLRSQGPKARQENPSLFHFIVKKIDYIHSHGFKRLLSINGLSAVFPARLGSAETGFHCEGPVKRKPWRKSRIYVQEKDRLGGRGCTALYTRYSTLRNFTHVHFFKDISCCNQCSVAKELSQRLEKRKSCPKYSFSC